MTDFEKQDYLLKYLLRNMMYGYCAGLNVLFFLFTIDMNIFIHVFLLTATTILSLVMLTCGLYVGHLQSMTMALYEEFNGSQEYSFNQFIPGIEGPKDPIELH